MEDLDQKIRRIANEVYRQNTKNDQFTNANIQFHTHNGIDSPVIQPTSISGFSDLTTFGPAGVLGVNNVSGGVYVQSTEGNTSVYPIPLMFHGIGGGFSGGDAPDGTMFISSGGGTITTLLWIMIDGTWFGFQAFTSI